VSKGPGKQQRRILAALERCPAFYLAELRESGTRAEHISLLRAAWALCEAEKIDILRYTYGPQYVVVTRRGNAEVMKIGERRYEPPKEDALRLSVKK
jgi:hypothetical protein